MSIVDHPWEVTNEEAPAPHPPPDTRLARLSLVRSTEP
jgi:hypothetical protein